MLFVRFVTGFRVTDRLEVFLLTYSLHKAESFLRS